MKQELAEVTSSLVLSTASGSRLKESR